MGLPCRCLRGVCLGNATVIGVKTVPVTSSKLLCPSCMTVLRGTCNVIVRQLFSIPSLLCHSFQRYRHHFQCRPGRCRCRYPYPLPTPPSHIIFYPCIACVMQAVQIFYLFQVTHTNQKDNSHVSHTQEIQDAGRSWGELEPSRGVKSTD